MPLLPSSAHDIAQAQDGRRRSRDKQRANGYDDKPLFHRDFLSSDIRDRSEPGAHRKQALRFQHDLAEALALVANAEGRRYRDLAVVAARRSVELYRQLADANPDEYRASLAAALRTLARRSGWYHGSARLLWREARRLDRESP